MAKPVFDPIPNAGVEISGCRRRWTTWPPSRGLSLDEYRSDRFRLKGAERLLQETVEAAVDANLHLVRAAGGPTPPDYYQSFVELGRHGVIPASLAERLAPAAGLRNHLVHEYDVIDDSIVLQAVGAARRDFREYVAALESHLSTMGL